MTAIEILMSGGRVETADLIEYFAEMGRDISSDPLAQEMAEDAREIEVSLKNYDAAADDPETSPLILAMVKVELAGDMVRFAGQYL